MRFKLIGLSEFSNEDYDDNDRFLEELERENMMLEKELETLVQLKSAQQREIQQDTFRSPLVSPVHNLEKIEEKIEEERESYYFSNSDDEQRSSKRVLFDLS